MTGGVILAAYALAAGYGAPAVLSRDWARRSPRIAIGLWLTMAASWLAAVPLAEVAPTGRPPLPAASLVRRRASEEAKR